MHTSSPSRPPRSSGFTLVEILLVVTILVVLGVSALLTIKPLTQIFKGYDIVRKTDLAKLKTAFESYYEDRGCYPPQSILAQCGSTTLSPYIGRVPCDPSTDEPYELFYQPEGTTCAQSFVIYATLANIFDPDGKHIPSCDGTYAVHSSDLNQTIVIQGCSGQNICSRLYGCISGTCQLIAEDSAPTCYPSYCNDNNCNGRCGDPTYECTPL